MAVDAEIAQEIEHLLHFLHVRFLVDGGVRRDLVAENLRHLDREDAFLEDAFAFHDQIMRPLQTVEMDIPIHPFARPDRRLRRIFRSLLDRARFLLASSTRR